MEEQISVKQLVSEGKSAYQQGDFLTAARAFEAAAESYTAAGNALNAAEMSNNSSVAFLQAGEAQEALRSVEGTPAVFAAAGDKRRQGISLGNLGAALEAVGRLDEAAVWSEALIVVLAGVGLVAILLRRRSSFILISGIL